MSLQGIWTGGCSFGWPGSSLSTSVVCPLLPPLQLLLMPVQRLCIHRPRSEVCGALSNRAPRGFCAPIRFQFETGCRNNV